MNLETESFETTGSYSAHERQCSTHLTRTCCIRVSEMHSHERRLRRGLKGVCVHVTRRWVHRCTPFELRYATLGGSFLKLTHRIWKQEKIIINLKLEDPWKNYNYVYFYVNLYIFWNSMILELDIRNYSFIFDSGFFEKTNRTPWLGKLINFRDLYLKIWQLFIGLWMFMRLCKI